jgi:hypothetical protein
MNENKELNQVKNKIKKDRERRRRTRRGIQEEIERAESGPKAKRYKYLRSSVRNSLSTFF